MDQTVREFLRARLDLIDDYNLRQIYEDADMFLISSDIKQVTQALIDAGINPINYLNRIPSYFYSNDTKITDVTIPSNIKFSVAGTGGIDLSNNTHVVIDKIQVIVKFA